MATIEEYGQIQDVQLVRLVANEDERGRFVETFRKEWFPQRSWDRVQGNLSHSAAGVLRGLHYHHRQVDYWTLMSGSIRVGLYDLRRSSSTYGIGRTLEIHAEDAVGLYIPTGIAHGFLALTDIILSYLVDNYYDGTDENGVAWNDPDIAMDWGVQSPNVSPRDAENLRLREIPREALPD